MTEVRARIRKEGDALRDEALANSLRPERSVSMPFDLMFDISIRVFRRSDQHFYYVENTPMLTIRVRTLRSRSFSMIDHYHRS